MSTAIVPTSLVSVGAVESDLMNKLLDAHPTAEALAVWHDKPGLFIAHATSWIWEVLKEVDPVRLEEVLASIEHVDDGQSEPMIRHQHAVCAWVRAERDLHADEQYQKLSNDPELLAHALKVVGERRGS